MSGGLSGLEIGSGSTRASERCPARRSARVHRRVLRRPVPRAAERRGLPLPGRAGPAVDRRRPWTVAGQCGAASVARHARAARSFGRNSAVSATTSASPRRPRKTSLPCRRRRGWCSAAWRPCRSTLRRRLAGVAGQCVRRTRAGARLPGRCSACVAVRSVPARVLRLSERFAPSAGLMSGILQAVGKGASGTEE